jgi:selenocysteine lyase/cysteine desulfurase
VPYLNHAGTSFPKPEGVRRAVSETLTAPADKWGSIYDEAFRRVRSEFPDEGRLLVTSGCTSALALAMGDVPLRPGQRVVTSAFEHHALDRQARALELARDVIHDALPQAGGDLVDLERLRDKLKGGDVALVAMTASSNITGDLLPLSKVSALCREHGVPFLVDAAQTFGTKLFEPAARYGDIIVAAGHKSALGPHGVGVLFARSSIEFTTPGAACEVGEQECTTFPGFCDAGSVNLAGLSGLSAGLSWTADQGRASLARRAETAAEHARELLGARERVRVLGGAGPDSVRMPVVSFVHEELSLKDLDAAFLKAGFHIRVGTHCAPRALSVLGAEEGCARISWGPFNNEHETEELLEFLSKL